MARAPNIESEEACVNRCFRSDLCSGSPQHAQSDPDYAEEGAVVTDFDIFLSHNSVDKASVEIIAHKLQTEGLNPWLDKWCLVPGRPWQQELATILRSCPTIGVFIGQNGLGDWAREELHAIEEPARRVGLSFEPDLGEGTEDTRRRASIEELVTAPEEADVVERVVRAMVDARLLTTSGA